MCIGGSGVLWQDKAFLLRHPHQLQAGYYVFVTFQEKVSQDLYISGFSSNKPPSDPQVQLGDIIFIRGFQNVVDPSFFAEVIVFHKAFPYRITYECGFTI
jgi:hypothetical protein